MEFLFQIFDILNTGALVSRRAERWRAEVRSHLDRLLLDASRHALDGPVPGGGSPAAVAHSLAGRVADRVAEHVGGAVEGDR